MLDLTTVKRRYFQVKFNEQVIDVEPPKLKTLNALVSLARAANNGDQDADADMTPLIAKLLSKNKKGYVITPEVVEESLDSDQTIFLLTEFFQWIRQEKNDPN